MATEIPESKYQREWVKGLKPFQSGKVPEEFKWLYSQEEAEELLSSETESRMIAGISKHYMELAKRSEAVLNLIKARKEETLDLSGEVDPSNQLSYSPVNGILHKYEIILLYVSRTCSAHCRYCYRLDLFTGKTDKPMANIEEVRNYIIDHNKKVDTIDQSNVNEHDRIYKIREVLLSGGDPMVLANKKLYEYMSGAAEANISTVRIGTKELAFFPQRFDDSFFQMLEIFHKNHPTVNINFIIHFTHPDEFLDKDEKGNYIKQADGYKWLDVTKTAVERLRSYNFVSLENQTPIIYRVNDDADAIRLMQIELRRKGVHNHYFFQCREIEGHRAFAVPVEETWKIHNRSQAGLSGVERSRLTMSTEWGKLEVLSVIDGPSGNSNGELSDDQVNSIKDVFGDGLVVFKVHRAPYAAENQGDLVIARRNPEALWMTGYEDRIIYDGRNIGKSKFKGFS